METNDYVIQYPLEAVHPDKFAELVGKPASAIESMAVQIERVAEQCQAAFCNDGR
ncbi:hypothetical protein [Citrobacter sp. Ct235]|uniref:hypothetical protein n=1 Tax=Citrobacter sp. Ct235 TaxID=2985157 RepID=UPI0025752007|nr:hypothetical protein [Citrobacter sp. Ct235]